MLNAIIIGSMLMLYTMQSLLCRLYTDAYPNENRMAPAVFTAVSAITVPLVSLIVSGFTFSVSPMTVVYAIGCGLVCFLYDTFMIKASNLGPYSVMMVFCLTGPIIIPPIVTAIVYGEYISAVQIVSMIVIVICIYLVSLKDGEGVQDNTGKRMSVIFIVFSIILMLSNGFFSVFLDVQQRETGVAEKEEMAILAYIFAGVISLSKLFITERRKALTAFKLTRRSAIYLCLYAVVAAVALILQMTALTRVNSVLLFTINNAGVLVLSTVASCIVFREKMTKVNILGAVLITLALVVFSLHEYVSDFILSLFA